MKCEHDTRFGGVFDLPKGCNGCLACFAEMMSKRAKLFEAIERAAGELPEEFQINICVERHSGWVNLYEFGGLVSFQEGDGDLTAQVLNAVAMAVEMHKKAIEGAAQNLNRQSN